MAEILAVSPDGNTVVYTDAEQEVLAFLDITNPSSPMGLGTVALGGEPTSVAVCGDYAIVCINTSPSFTVVSGSWLAIDIASQTIVHTDALPGQPDSIAVSPDCTKAVVAIENERDEDLRDGRIPQLPAGEIVVLDLMPLDTPSSWSLSTIDITGLDGVLEPTDPEPEFVDINSDNIAVVTLQENNALVLIDLEAMEVMSSFSAGTVNLRDIDKTEDRIIDPTERQRKVPREPDGVAWIGKVSGHPNTLNKVVKEFSA